MPCVSVLSTEQDSASATKEVLGRAADALGGKTADLVLLFASADHAQALGRLASELRERRLARHVLGCTGETIVGEDREVEQSPALSLWAIGHAGLEIRPVRIAPGEEDSAASSLSAGGSLILLGDPFSFPADDVLRGLNKDGRGVRVLGGMASGGNQPGLNRLVLDDEVFVDGAVGVELGSSVALRSVVSQGCRPIGRPMIVTKTERNIIRELGRRPALEVFREVYEGLESEDQERVQQGLHIGRVINEYQESFGRGDFLVRNVMGADDNGGIAITDMVRVGQTVQFHIRDSDTADEDLRTLLQQARKQARDGRVEGALLFSCNGRGTRLFPGPNHDVRVLHEVFGKIPVAGFFAMGEIGPVGGQNFLHGYTASIVLFETTQPGTV